VTVTFAPTYCTNTNTVGTTHYISNVTTTGAVTNISNSTGFSTSGYGNFTGMSASQYQGSVVNFSITEGGGSMGFGIWVDWNQDGDFADAGEQVYNSAGYYITATGSFTVPLTATTGNTRMRVVGDYLSTSPVACPGNSYTECEDYTFNVIFLPPCSGTPTAGAASASPSSITSCASTTTVLSLTGAAVAGNITYQWQSSPDNATWTNIAGATNSSYSTSLTVSTYFQCVLTCTSSGLSATSTSTLVTSTISAPANDNCSGAIALTVNAYGSCTTTSAGNVSCATSSGIPLGSCFGTPDDDIWYSFVATSNGVYNVTLTTSSGFDAYMQLFSGTCGALTSMQCSDPNTFSTSSLVSGTTYYIRVYSYSSGAPSNGNITLCVSAPPLCPANLGSGNVAIASLPYSGTGLTTCSAGNEITTSNAVTCGSAYYFSDMDKVFTFTPATSGSITITINSTQTWTGATLYDACPFSGNCVGYVQSSSSGSKNFCTSVIAGVTYYLVVDSWGTTGSCITSFSLNITAPSAGFANELPCGATSLTLGTALAGDNTCSGGASEPAAPSCWTSGSVNTVWYSFTAPASGIAYVQTTATSITSTQIAVYAAPCGSSMTLVACNQSPPVGCTGTPGTGSVLNLSGLTGGAVYYVAVDGRLDYTGTFSILVNSGSSGSSSPVPGQDCQIPLLVCNSVMTIGNPGYSNTGNVCDFDGSDDCTSGELNSVWYQISIAATGNFNFTLKPNDGSNTSCGSETDYDFLLWRISGTGATTTCAGITAASSGALLACNFDGYGVTGIAPSGNAPSPISSCFDFAFEPTVAVTAGDVLYLCIQNYTGSTQGFTLDMTSSGTGVVNYTAPSTVYWTGGASTVWSNVTNWGSCSTYPVCGVNAVITAASATQPVITGTEYVKDLTINPGATLTLNAGATLHICGNFTNNGTLTASPTSTIIFDNAAVAQSINGSFTGANKFGNLTVTKTGGSVTVNNNIDIGGTFTTSNSTSVLNSNNFYIKLAGNFVNAAGNTTFTNTGTTGTLEFNGAAAQTYNQGSTQLDLNNVVMNNTTGGVTLQTDMNIKSTTGTLTLTLGKIITTASYKVVVSNATPPSVSTGNTSSYVYGFLRRYINNSTGSFDFPVGTATAYQRANVNFTSAPTITYLTADFQTYATLPGPLGISECAATYNMNALDNGFWNIDANTANNNTGMYNMTLYNTAYTNAATGWTVMARHNGSATWDIVNGDGTYGTCVTSPVTAVVRNGMRGFSKFGTAQSNTPLPIELISFTGKNEGSKNLLQWSTASETNNDYFSLEHSADGSSFETFITKEGAGNSSVTINYDAYDYSPYNGTTYYRLKQTDYNGKFSYSSIISIQNKLDQVAVSNVHPNPTTNDLNFDFYSPVKGTVRIMIIDYTGRIVVDRTQAVEEGKSGLNTQMGELAKGVYSLKVEFSEGGFKSITKVVKY